MTQNRNSSFWSRNRRSRFYRLVGGWPVTVRSETRPWLSRSDLRGKERPRSRDSWLLRRLDSDRVARGIAQSERLWLTALRRTRTPRDIAGTRRPSAPRPAPCMSLGPPTVIWHRRV